MKNDLQKYLDFHRINGGTGKIFQFEMLEYKAGFLKLKGIMSGSPITFAGQHYLNLVLGLILIGLIFYFISL